MFIKNEREGFTCQCMRMNLNTFFLLSILWLEKPHSRLLLSVITYYFLLVHAGKLTDDQNAQKMPVDYTDTVDIEFSVGPLRIYSTVDDFIGTCICM